MSGEYLPAAIEATRELLEESMHVVLVSTQDVPVFWLSNQDQADIVRAHQNFVEASKMMLIVKRPELREVVYMTTQFVSLNARLLNEKQLQSANNSVTSSDLKVISPHPLCVDEESILADDKTHKQQTLEKMFTKNKEVNDAVNM